MHSGIVLEKKEKKNKQRVFGHTSLADVSLSFLTSGSNFVCLKNAKEDSAPLVLNVILPHLHLASPLTQNRDCYQGTPRQSLLFNFMSPPP